MKLKRPIRGKEEDSTKFRWRITFYRIELAFRAKVKHRWSHWSSRPTTVEGMIADERIALMGEDYW